jgi:hypothetical protein
MLPVWLMPVRSPFTSAMNTGTPMREKRLGQGLQRHRLAGAGGAGDQAVAVGQAGQQVAFGGRRAWQSAGVRPFRVSSGVRAGKSKIGR